MYPPFDADILHYALAAVRPARRRLSAGAQLTLLRADAADNVGATTGTLNASVTVGGAWTVAQSVTADGQTRTYVVASGGYSDRVTFLAVLDNNAGAGLADSSYGNGPARQQAGPRSYVMLA